MPIIVLMLSLFSNKSFAQNPIGAGLHPVIGDLFHTGGRIGVGTETPNKLLHLYTDTVTTLRLSSACSKCDSTNWDFNVYQGNLKFVYNNSFKYLPVVTLTEYGQFSLNNENPESSAIMQLESTDKGLLIPRLTSDNIKYMSSPADGLLVYNIDSHTFSYYDASTSSWLNIAETGAFSDYLTVSDFNSSAAGGITQSDIANWNTAYNFSQNFSEADPVFTAHLTSGITAADTADWFSFSKWDKNYNDLTNRPDFTAWDTDASDDFDRQWNSLTGTIPSIGIFANDAGYITDADINNLWEENSNGNIYRQNGYVGIGTENPAKSFEIYSVYNLNAGSLLKKSVIRLTNQTDYYEEPKNKALPEPNPTPPKKLYKWDIENNNDSLKFKYINYNPSDIALGQPIPEPETKFTVSGDGTLTAAKFIGDGSGLTNIGNGEPIILDEDIETWTNSGWSPRLQSKLGTVWASMDKSNQGDFFLGLGMTNSGWYFMTRKDDKTKRYVCHIDQNGFIRATKIKVEQRNWSDYVFKTDYGLMPLNKLETYIKQNKHLPEIPSETEIIQNGLDLGDMQKLQMQKIEELTLYIIELNKRIESLEKENTELKRK